MDREILFRAKRADGNGYDGGWIYGYGATGDQIIHLDIYAGFIGAKVDPSTVGQYTGLTEKNGMKIFEGDIVKTNKYGKDDGQGHNFAGQDTFEVAFKDGGYCLRNKWRRFNLRPDAGIEVISSVHDNPELIGG